MSHISHSCAASYAQTVVMAVAYNGRQLLLTAVFVIILVYLYAIIALLSFRDAYGNEDSTVRASSDSEP